MHQRFHGKNLKKNCLKSYKIVLLLRAQREILEAKEFYEVRRKGFGRLFALELQNELRKTHICLKRIKMVFMK